LGAYAAFGTGGKTVVPRAIESVEIPGAGRRAVPPAEGKTIFSREVSYLVFDILSDPDARRPMFGDMPPLFPFPVALKTGTTRAYTDNLAFGVTREFTVAAWAGNFDGKPTDGVMAIQGAAPLVRAAFLALAHRFGDPSAPSRPEDVVEAEICPISGMRAGPHSHAHKREKFIRGTAPTETCDWHRVECGQEYTAYPDEVRGWARAQGLLQPLPCGHGVAALRILFPASDSHFLIDPGRPLEHQVPPLRASPVERQAEIRWTIDGAPPDAFRPSPGAHHVRAALGQDNDEVQIYFD
jgi:penicillin-binding protein 1C